MILGNTLGVLFLAVPALLAQGMADRYYQAIRNDDTASLERLVKASGTDVRDKRGDTPLMLAAAFGSLESMRILIAAGADVNAKNSFDATALLWCATDLAKVRLLVEKGANVNAKSKQGRTPLLVAASSDGAVDIVRTLLDHKADLRLAEADPVTTPLTAAIAANDTATVKLLLDRGAPAAGPAAGFGLVFASGNGNVEIMKMLLARGADPDTTSPGPRERVKNGLIQIGSLTPLIAAAAYGGPDAIQLLLQNKAKVNARDVRGMTPLMLAIASDRPSVPVIRMLLAAGADPKLKSNEGESAIDWAHKFGDPAVLAALGLEPRPFRAALKPAAPPLALAVERSAVLLQRTGASFFVEGGCASCHSHNLGSLALDAVRTAGLKVDAQVAGAMSQQSKAYWTSQEQLGLQRIDTPGGADMNLYGLLQFQAEQAAPGLTIDAMIHNLAAQQQVEGNWHITILARSPMEDGDFARTALPIRFFALYGPAGRKAEFARRIALAADWLRKAQPRSTEDRNMQLLGLKWAGAAEAELKPLAERILAKQNADGGWAQTDFLASDAYGTGQTLYTLRELGIAANHPAYARGMEFLLRTQLPDGSWHVASRAPKFQPYFQSGFPHDHDQWISMAATSWATLALASALPPAVSTASVR